MHCFRIQHDVATSAYPDEPWNNPQTWLTHQPTEDA